uniref:Uncharacterized protein n=1 Tax=Spongospora subterranea TaxID=70186 RepID=A0A0H5RT38_9EUKA|eukprot:CRZ11899.1 hypothetical protein [Spongospora subterranea]
MAIFFFYHPMLGDSNLSMSGRALGFKPNTLEDWVYTKSLRCKWSPFFRSLKSANVVKSIVLNHFKPKFADVAEIPASVLSSIAGLSKPSPATQLTFHFDSDNVQKLVAVAKRSNSQYVKRETNRISVLGALGHKPKISKGRLFLDTFIRKRWDNGNPCSVEQVFTAIRSHFVGSTVSEDCCRKIGELSNVHCKGNGSVPLVEQEDIDLANRSKTLETPR